MDEKIFDFAYLLACRDATQRKAYPRNSDDYESFRTRKEDVFKNSRDSIREYIKSIFNDKHPDSVPLICAICDDERHFTFGNAQKLVNMVAKYMYIATYNDERKRQLFNNCHCPMDGHMLDCVNEKFPEDKITCSWSKLEYKNGVIPTKYIVFQSRVKILAEAEGLLPIEFDYMNW